MFDSPRKSTAIQLNYEDMNCFDSPMAPQKGFRSRLENSEFSVPTFELDQAEDEPLRRKMAYDQQILPATKPFSIASWDIEDNLITPQKQVQNIHMLCEAPEKQNSA